MFFDDDWQVVARDRVPTPQTYDALVDALVAQIGWADARAGQTLPVGIGAAGLLNPVTGHAFTANICASGRPLPRDVTDRIGRPVTYINDCRALALSEAIFGRGKGYRTVMSLIIGTGVGGGVATNGELMCGPANTGGEFGHVSAPAHLVCAHDLPIFTCGCGRAGCIETYIAGPGLTRLAEAKLGRALRPPELIAARATDPAAQAVWALWCDLTADLLRSLAMTIDPDMIVLGGGLSQIDGLIPDLEAASVAAQLGDFAMPPLFLAEGGDTSGARGAAYAAFLDG